MTTEKLRQRLRSLQTSLPSQEVFQTVLDMLNQSPSENAREVLEAWLMGYAFCDEDRVALYWKPFLEDENFLLKMRAMNRLFILASKSALARNILREFLEEEPTEEALEDKLRGLFLNRPHSE